MVPVVDVAASTLPREYSRASADRLAERTAVAASEVAMNEQLSNGGELIRTAVPIRSSPNGPVRGVVIASQYLTGQFAARARGMTNAYESYQQLRVLRRPLTGVYLSFFLMLTLMILVAATWMGLYLAKRITRPVQMLATAAKEIGAGHLDHRVVPETADEFGSLIDAFNRMAGELSASRRRLERSSVELEKKHHEVEGRRRYVETVLDRIATGVVSVDAAGRIRTANSAASRLLGVDASVIGLPAADVLGVTELKPLATLIDEASRSRDDARPQEVAITRGGRDLHLAVMTTPLRRDDGLSDGRRRRLRRRDATHSRAEGGGLARGRAAAGARDQEPADADPALRRAHAASLLGRARADARARRGVHGDHRRRGGVAEGAR